MKQPDTARASRFWHRFLRGLLVAAMLTGGSTVALAAPASAAWGGCDNANGTVSACVNFGDNGNSVRADFYFKKVPDSSYYTYYVWIFVDGYGQLMASNQRLTYTGRYCCWTRPTDSLPNRIYRVFVQVAIYTSSGVYHTGSISPTITYSN
ncbi:hypothetical protein Rhe02_22470 [Rhizocola hellebori]|uniref:Secreted protein n=1 Tax=Rhizocola hellebori TaxID=1392758 RepID=A0A8J3VF36_9ACTN|nr:hypothetical protein Rhe02_22470 [Rhizocola hellebori]